MKPRNHDNWTTAESAALYGIDRWGAGNFTLSGNGEVNIRTEIAGKKAEVSLVDIVRAAEDRGYSLPLLVRVDNLLDERIELLNETFRRALRETGYRGHYTGVYPVKVNQQRAVIEEIRRSGRPYGHGLEAGSKAELLLCLANLNDNGLLICNGYKDRDFIDLGLWANKLGQRCFFVIESPAELPLIMERSRVLGIRPLIGLRIKISARVGGLWTETSGDRSSFGLTTAQLIAMVDQLRAQDMLDCLQLLHCHLGSQIPDIEQIRTGVREASRFYADLAAEGVPLHYLDLGGGLAIDYIGNRSNHSHSRNYRLLDYCRCIAETVRDTLEPQAIAHPTIVTESGRATVAHTSVLLFNVLDAMTFDPLSVPDSCSADFHPLVVRQFDLYRGADRVEPAACYTEALRNRDRIRDLFRAGDIDVRQRSTAENLFLAVARGIKEKLEQTDRIPPGLSTLVTDLADIYYGNFSVFQSLPDSWAIDQMFPVMPIQRLNEYPRRQASISDLTCDCDGKLDRFILAAGESPTLPLHELTPSEDYILGVFLMGAYQETLGDLHNLFGDTDVISIRMSGDGEFDVTKEQSGDTVAQILEMLEYNPASFFEGFRDKVENSVKTKKISVSERRQLLTQFRKCLAHHSYFRS